MKLHESAEDYLERILMLTKKNGKVKSIDIAEDMHYSKASVSIAMKKLKEKNYITIENGFILLTDEGYQVANEMFERHNIISSLLVELGVDKKFALEDACKIEHVISPESFEAIKNSMARHKEEYLK